jgi:peptidoglycan/LPS O-acetylase OafA/YrhL
VAQFGPCFLAGVVAYALQSRVAPRFSPWLWIVTIAALMGLYVLLEELEPAIHPPILAWTTCLALGVAIPCFRDLPAGSLQRACQVIARYSYGIYLLHSLVLWVAFYAIANQSRAVQLGSFVVLMVGLPVLCYHAIEVPLVDVGRRLTKSRGAARLMATGAEQPTLRGDESRV